MSARALLAAAALLAGAADCPVVRPGVALRFPADHGAHPTGMTIVLGPPPGPRDGGPRRMS